ncbi:MAG: serine--tRNA ligase [Planctomycetota bacterium]|nr:MAG: serine--tRNA ligase [Planctomycetota bacterium]
MLDIKFVKKNRELVQENCRRRKVEVDVSELLELYERKLSLQRRLQEIQQRRNQVAKRMKGSLSKEERLPLVEEGRRLKEEEAGCKEELARWQERFEEQWQRLPNLTHPEVPVGEDEGANRVLRTWGEPRKFSFPPKDHVQLGEEKGLVDFRSAAKVSGAKFYYLKGDGVWMELALVRFALEILRQRGFEIYATPDLAYGSILEGIGFNPRGEETQVYSIANSPLCLIGTAEITLGGMYQDTILEGDRLPLLLGGVSHCFRTEAGAGGKVSKGLYRVHQFTKVEMFAFCAPEDSERIHRNFLEIEEEIYQKLEIPYRVVDVCTGELGAPAYRKFDIEAWMPGRGEGGEYGEVTSTSNCTDYQARRLKIRFRRGGGRSTEYVHMLNGTAVAVSRTLIALWENHQQEDGSIRVPEALRPYFGKDRF